MRKYTLIITIFSATIVFAYFAVSREEKPLPIQESPTERRMPIAIPETPAVPVITEPELPESIMHDVPFTPQAPSAQWSDPVFQNACEEASIIMAAAWASGNILPPKSALGESIRSLSALAEIRFGEHTYDTSVEDTAELLREYSGSAAAVVNDTTLDDIRNALRMGDIVIAPFDGRKLGNPNYTRPGPEYHMLVIIGYDAGTGEFVTNDPGTRHGAAYRYAEDVLFEAIRDYRTGYHLPTTDIPGKNVIMISRTDGSGKK